MIKKKKKRKYIKNTCKKTILKNPKPYELFKNKDIDPSLGWI